MLTVVGLRCGYHNRVCIWRALGQHVIAIFAHSDSCVHCSQGQGNKNTLDVQQHMSWRRKPGVCVGGGFMRKTGSWGSILQKGEGRGGWWSRCDMGMSVRRGIEGEESGTSKGWSRKHRYGKLRGDHIRPQTWEGITLDHSAMQQSMEHCTNCLSFEDNWSHLNCFQKKNSGKISTNNSKKGIN